MYVVNADKTDTSKLYKCGKLICDWLIYTAHLSPFGRSDDGNWYFSKTEKLNKALEELPIYLKLISVL